MNISSTQFSRWMAVGLLAATFVLGGCATGTDLVAAGRVAVEPHIDRTLREPPEVTDDNGDLLIAGRLARGLPRDLGGHIDISVIAPDGRALYDAQVTSTAADTSASGGSGPKEATFRRNRNHRTGSYGVYSVRFPGLPPDGSVVKVRYEPATHPVESSHP